VNTQKMEVRCMESFIEGVTRLPYQRRLYLIRAGEKVCVCACACACACACVCVCV